MNINLKSIAHILGGEVKGNQALVPGPNHSRKDRSLSITVSDSGDDIVVHSFAGDDPIECKKYIKEKCGIQHKPNGNGHSDVDLAKLINDAVASQRKEPRSKPVATYDYRDGDNTLLYQMLRFEPKRFQCRQPDGHGGWIYRGTQRRVLYRYPDLLKFPSATIFITEGEKDADRLWSIDLCATTVASGKWTDDCVQALAGRHVLILEDNDEAGRKKALEAAGLLHDVADTVRIVRLPGLSEGEDVSDWLDTDPRRGASELADVCFDAPLWEPTAERCFTGEKTLVPETHFVKPVLQSGPANFDDVANTNPKTTEDKKTTASAPLCFVKIEDWLDHDPPPRDWAVPNRFPLRNVSLLSGEGSIGKTIVLMQLAAAHVFGRGWLDTLPEPGDAIYLNAEDEETELHRRFVDIARLYDTPLSELKDHLHLLAMAGQDAVLAHVNRHGLVKPTPLFHKLTEAAGDIKPKFIGLDTSADVFAGAENDRSQVRQFIGLLRGMAIAGNSAVIVCAHPSLTGINTGTGLSGSTAWHNSVRARAYLHSVTVDDTEPDKTLRQLDFMKSNYSAIADSVTLRWKDGVFIMEAKPGSLEKMAADAKADEAFITLLKRFNDQGRNVSHVPGPTYAPVVFAKADTNFKKAQLVEAMDRLFNANKIRVEDYGRPSRPYRRIVMA